MQGTVKLNMGRDSGGGESREGKGEGRRGDIGERSTQIHLYIQSGRRTRTCAKSIFDRLNGEGNKIPYMQLLHPG